MIETVLVSVSGPAFSFLLYENAESEYDQEGFLLGETYEKETKSITDNEQEEVKLERVIRMNSAIPCPYTCYFYDSMGKVNIERLQSLLGDKLAEVVAWYKFRHSPGFKLTLREKIIHKQLADVFQTPSDLFTTCLLTKEVSDNHSTHLFSQTFVRYSNTIYQPLPMHIVNLSDPNNSYRKPQSISRTFKNLLESANIDLRTTQGLKIIAKLHNALQKEKESVLAELTEVEKIFELEEEIKQLKLSLNWKTETRINATKSDEVIENNSVGNGCSDPQDADSTVEKEDVALIAPPHEKKTTRARTKAVKEIPNKKAATSPVRSSSRNLKSEAPEVVKTRSQTAGKVSNNVSYSQVTQRRK